MYFYYLGIWICGWLTLFSSCASCPSRFVFLEEPYIYCCYCIIDSQKGRW